MRERPILFSAPMVRAILEGSKTQTRRVVKPRHDWFVDDGNNGTNRVYLQDYVTGEPEPVEVQCPYGEIGDRLWVREAWTPDHAAFYPNIPVVYRADRGYEYERNDRGEVYSPEQKAWYPYRWRPSIHMPRAASRITLEITGVRVERLQDISEADAMAEGCQRIELGPHEIGGTPVHPMTSSYAEAFRRLWQSINGPESWAANPWVWVIQFRRLE